MPIGSRLHSPRRLLLLFLAVTLVPSAALAWLGWQFVTQDRALQGQRLREVLERAAATVVAALDRELDALEQGLPQLPDAGPDVVPVDAAMAVRVRRAGVVARSGALLLYVPPDTTSSSAPEPQESVWADAERLEFAERNRAGAEQIYRNLARSSDPDTRAAALVRLARVLKASGRANQALDAYASASSLTTARINGDPADLLTRWARVELLRTLNRKDAAESEAASIARDLANGRWPIDRTSFAMYSATLDVGIDDSTAAATSLTDAALAVWADWKGAARDKAADSGRRLIPTTGGSVLAVWRQDAESLVVFAALPNYAKETWGSIWTMPDLNVTLVDDDGRVVVGVMPVGDTDQTLRKAAVETSLPWTVLVTAAPTLPEVADAGRARRRVVIAGLAVLAFLLPASAYLVHRAVQRELAAARQQANFMSAVSHEFRSPLTSLTHLTSLLRGEFQPSDDRRRQYYDVLARETDRLRRFVDTLLDFGRMQAGAARYRLAPLDVSPFIQNLVEEFRRDPAGDGRQVSCTTPDGATCVSADGEALGRAVWNLLENAVKYSPGGAPVAVMVEADERSVAIRITDKGPGIPADEQPFVFQQFYRGAAALESAVRGTGVGLAVVQHIVSAHGGKVRLDSRPGTGSTFSILLPRVDRASTNTTEKAS